MNVREKLSTEKRLIDYCYLAEKIECPGVPLVYWEDIEAAPTVDAVPVVRCCECRHAVKIGKYGCYCRNNSTPWFNGEFEVYMDQDDFCSYGERKEGAE